MPGSRTRVCVRARDRRVYACVRGAKEKNVARALADDGKKKIKRGMEKRTANMEWPLVGHDSLSTATF